MVPGAINETDRRDGSRAGVVRWCGVSLILHLVVAQLPDRFAIDAVVDPTTEPILNEQTIELTTSSAPEPPVSNMPMELPPASEGPKSALRRESVPVVEPPTPGDRTALHAEPGETADDTPAADDATSEIGTGGAPAASEIGAAGATAAEIAEAETEASRPFADLEPSRPGERLMFDPFRANRAQSSGGLRLLIDFSRLRRHPLGIAVGGLLARADPSALLGPTGIDPVRDAERLFIHAPNFRDWSGLVMMIQHRIPSADLRARLDRRLDNASKSAEREAPFLVTPKPGLLIVTPPPTVPSPEEMTSLQALPSSAPPSFVWAHFETPWRVFLGTPLAIPRSLRWAEVLIAPDSGGGMTVRVEAEAEDERSASADAAHLVAAISDGLGLPAGAGPTRERTSERARMMEFHTRGSIIIGTCRLDAAQVADLVEDMLRRSGEKTPPPSTNP